MRRSSAQRDEENSSVFGSAGWLFADLLLGLAVIFLAMSVVGNDGESSAAAPTTTTTTTTTTVPRPQSLNPEPRTLALTRSGIDCRTDDADCLAEAVKTFAGGRRVGFALFWGCNSDVGVGEDLAAEARATLEGEKETDPALARILKSFGSKTFAKIGGWGEPGVPCRAGGAYVDLWFYS